MKASQRFHLNRLADKLVTEQRFGTDFAGFAAAQRSNPEQLDSGLYGWRGPILTMQSIEGRIAGKAKHRTPMTKEHL